MEENGSGKIAKLKEILHKWQNVTLSLNPHVVSDPPHGSIPPVISKRLADVKNCDSDDDSCCHSPAPPPDVPKGYLAVYVGPEMRRFIIPTSYLGHSLFKVLLEKAEEEFGFDNTGALTIPCEIETFKYLLQCIDREEGK